MSVCCECCVLSGRGFCDELITRPEESYRLSWVVVCDLETSGPLGALAPETNQQTNNHFNINLPFTLMSSNLSFFLQIFSPLGTYKPFSPPHCVPHSLLITLSLIGRNNIKWWGEISWNSSLWNLLHFPVTLSHLTPNIFRSPILEKSESVLFFNTRDSVSYLNVGAEKNQFFLYSNLYTFR